MTRGFGIIGVGTWGVNHARVYSTYPGVRLAAVCDIDEARAREVADKYGAAKVYADFRELVADPEVEAVSVVTPDFMHADCVVAAAEAGKHILLEKPLATTMDDARRMKAAVEKAGVKLMVDYHNRWNPAFYQAHQKIAAGELGAPVSARVRLHDIIHVPTEMLSWAGRSTILWFLGSHGVDLLRFLFGAEVETVYSVAHSGVLKARGVDTPDVYQTVLTFDNGVIASMETGWILPNSEPFILDFNCDIVCAEGAMRVNFSHHGAFQIFTPERMDYGRTMADVEIHGKTYGLILESIRHFADCVLEEKEPLVGLEDGIIGTQVLLAAERSAQTGQPVRVDSIV